MRFVLIHGGFHGAWCWERVIPELDSLGHEAIAIDLPGHGERRDESSSLTERRDAILAVLQPGDVLVGHSGGGYDISVAADAAPERIGHLIYLAAGVPLEGRPLIAASGGRPAEDVGEDGKTQLLAEESGMLNFTRLNAQGRMECCDYDAVKAFFYHDCDDDTARRAYARLSPAPVEFLLEPVHLPRFWSSNLPRSYIRCLQDRAAPPSLEPGFVARLGVDPLTIDASHSPFLSKPRQTAEAFVAATKSRPVGPMRPD